MNVLLCAATSTEAAGCRKGLSDAGAPSDFRVLQTGVGLERARASLKNYLSQERVWRPKLIISTGFAGALSFGLPLQSWVSASRVYSSSLELIAEPKTRFNAAAACGLISAPDLARQSAEKESQWVHRLGAPLAVDMESAALAEIAAEQRIDFAVLRLITDTIEAPLPAFVAEFASAMAQTSLRAKVLRGVSGMGQLLKDPRGAFRLVVEGKNWADDFRAGWSRFARDLAAIERSA